jgi:hypothetical protein
MAGGLSPFVGQQIALLLKQKFDGCCIRLYDSTQQDGSVLYPSDPSKAAIGTLLATVTVSGGTSGITWQTPTTEVLYKNPAEAWEEDSIVASGRVRYLRISPLTDDGTERNDIPRADFIAGTYAEYIAGNTSITARFENTTLVSGQPFRVNAASMTVVLSFG